MTQQQDSAIQSDFLAKLLEILKPDQLTQDTHDLEAYGKDWLKLYEPAPLAVVFPEDTQDVQGIMRLAISHHVGVVPSGGRTGLSGGATALNGELVVSLERMRKNIQINPSDLTATCDAGVTIEQLQTEAEKHGLYFPVDFASKGSCQIGGAIATNAGGIRVIKYGNMRNWVLGLTVVLADGQVLELNGALHKNQTGYSLCNLIVGSEGTLGIVTSAVLKLTTPPGELARALCGVESVESALNLLTLLRSAGQAIAPTDISAFEIFPAAGLEKVLQHHTVKDPFEERFPWYVVIEIEHINPAKRELLEEYFFELLENQTLAYVVLSQSSKQSYELMALRELLPDTLSSHYVVHKNDISVPIPCIPQFNQELEALITATYPAFEVIVFGHLGDGNLHINIIKPEVMATSDFKRQCKQSDHAVLGLVTKYRGSISAEHGVGLLKRDFLHLSQSDVAINLMRGIKAVFDPTGILNPGKVLP
jgi:FAD/FMN-containing dehydrogenase